MKGWIATFFFAISIVFAVIGNTTTSHWWVGPWLVFMAIGFVFLALGVVEAVKSR